jgi:hypothetical protein
MCFGLWWFYRNDFVIWWFNIWDVSQQFYGICTIILI